MSECYARYWFLQVCSDSIENFSFDATLNSAIAAMQKAQIGSQCATAIAAMSTTGDYITIECKFSTGFMLQDFLSIIFLASGAQCGETSVSRYCGYKLNPVFDQVENVPVCGKTTKMKVCINLVNDWPFFLDCTAPFAVGVHFDAGQEASSAIAGPARGFCLDYLQIPC